MLRKLKKYIKDPYLFANIVLNLLSPMIRNDSIFLKLKWKCSRMGYPLNLENPQSFCEKLQWLKLHDRNPDYTILVDKVKVKQWVANRIGKQHIIQTLGVWENPDNIDFDSLPNQFVLKCNHNSTEGVYICKDKFEMNKDNVIKTLRRALKRDPYWQNREWPYKNVKPMILAEQYMEDHDTQELRDYKFFCFDGEPKAMFIASGRCSQYEETSFDFYDMDFNHLPFTNGHPNSTKNIAKPKNFEEMKTIAAKLSVGIPHVRVDLYSVNGKTYFGEMTFTHWSGMVPFNPQKWDFRFGEWLKLPKINNNL